MNKPVANPALRILAGMLDFNINLMVFLGFVLVVAGAMTVAVLLDAILTMVVWGMLITPVAMIFFNCFLVARFGGTLGKILSGLNIVNGEGNKVSFWRAFFRNHIGYFVSGSFLWLGFMWIFKDKDRRGWHDLLADTYVVVAEKTGTVIGLFALVVTIAVNVLLVQSIVTNFSKNISSGVYAPIGEMMEDWSKSLKDTNTDTVRQPETMYFKGVVVSQDRGCDVDGVCNFTIRDEAKDNVVVDYDWGLGGCTSEAGVVDRSILVGDRVEAFVVSASDKDNLRGTICGSKDYYLRRVGPLPATEAVY